MKYTQFIPVVSLLSIIGCTSVDPYPVSGSYAKINELQILDPMAPEKNAGVVNDLEGNYGKKVIESYQSSSSKPSEGRQSENAQQLISSSSGSGN